MSAPPFEPPFLVIDHVQLAIPRGGEPAARRFYGEMLGFVEIPKPPLLAVRGGCWFESGDVKLHLGVEDDFRPALKAHPALRCRAGAYVGLLARLSTAGVEARPATEVPGVTRCHVDDPFGNRVELIADESDAG
jgi:catechol 2,3-dioxygenase-like lactoylglutathione lyase family enzyme